MGVGRKRKDGNPLGLEPRVEFHHGQFRYHHRDGFKVALGTDLATANAKARIFNDPDGHHGTLGYYIVLFLADAKAGRLPAGRKLRERTVEDYEREAEFLKASPLWMMLPTDIAREPNVLSDYRDHRVSDAGTGKVQANHGLALLSSTFAWLLEKTFCPGLQVNPVKLIRRFARKAKERYVEDREYRKVYDAALPSVRMAMALVYSTLQRPSDVLSLPAAPTRLKAVAGVEKRILPFQQSKTGRGVDIEVTAELATTLKMLAPDDDGKVVKLAKALVHGRGGEKYTEDGLASMLRRTCIKAKVDTFGLMDVRAKGATDMYLRGVALETIQRLMGHKSVTTTEIYIKRLIGTVSTVAPNVAVVGN